MATTHPQQPLPDPLRDDPRGVDSRGVDDPGLRPLPTYLSYRQSLSQRLSLIHMQRPSQSSGTPSLLPIEREEASAAAVPTTDGDSSDNEDDNDDEDYDLENRLSSYLTKNVAGTELTNRNKVLQENNTPAAQPPTVRRPPQLQRSQPPDNATKTVAVSFGGTTFAVRALGEDDKLSSLGDLGPSSRHLETFASSDDESWPTSKTPPSTASTPISAANRARQQQQHQLQAAKMAAGSRRSLDTPERIDEQQQQHFPEQALGRKVEFGSDEFVQDEDASILKESATNASKRSNPLLGGSMVVVKEQLDDWSYHCYDGRWIGWLLLFALLVGLPLGIGFGVTRQGSE